MITRRRNDVTPKLQLVSFPAQRNNDVQSSCTAGLVQFLCKLDGLNNFVDLHSGGALFESQSCYRPSWLTVSTIPLREWYLWTGNKQFLPNVYIFINHNHLPTSFDVSTSNDHVEVWVATLCNITATSGRGVKLTTHFHPVPRSRIPGAIPPLPQHAFMAWYSLKITRTTLPLPTQLHNRQDIDMNLHRREDLKSRTK